MWNKLNYDTFANGRVWRLLIHCYSNRNDKGEVSMVSTTVVQYELATKPAILRLL